MTEPRPFAAKTAARVVRATGKDAVAYLEDVTSQSVADLESGASRPALVLEASGEPIATYDVVAMNDHLLLVAPDEITERHALETMAGRTFLLEVTFEATELAVVAIRGGDEPGGPSPVARIARPHGIDLVTDDPEGVLAVTTVPSIHDPDEVRRALSDWDVAHGVPRWGDEITAPHLPEEIGILPTHVHLKKGCYPGQEAVARMWNLGRPRRRLAAIRVTGDVASGAEEGSGQQKILVTGVVGSDPGLGMAFVGRDSAVGDVYELAHGKVEVTGFVGAGLEPPGADPNVTRRRDAR